MTEEQPTRPRINYLRLVRRVAVHRWKLVLAVFLVVAAPVCVWAVAFAPKTYEATASIFIEGPKSGLLREWLPPSDSQFQLAILRSRSLAEAVADSLSREATNELLQRSIRRNYLLDVQNAIRRLLGREVVVYGPRERLLTEIQRARVTFTPSPSGEVTITAVAYQPVVATELANLYVEVLQARSRSYAREEARTAREFIENSLNQTKAALQEAEEALAKAPGGGAASKLPDRTMLDVTKLAQLENNLADIQVSKEIAKVQLNVLRGGKPGGGLSAAGRSTVQQVRERQLKERLAQLRDTLATLQEKYTDQHPQVLATQAEIKDFQERLAAVQAGRDAGPVADVPGRPDDRGPVAKPIADLELEIATVEAKEEALKPRIAALSRTLSSLGVQETERAKLVRRVQAQRNFYDVLSERLGTVRIQEQAERPAARVIDFAIRPTTPSSASVSKTVLLGLLLALGAGAALGAVVEYAKMPVETEDDVVNLTGLPVLGWLPKVESPAGAAGRNGLPLSFAEAPESQPLPLEGCRSIRTSLESLGRPDAPLQTIMLASAGPREGKSTVLLNLAWVFWERGRRVVIVDSDLRRPSLHRVLPAAPGTGLAELLDAHASWSDVRRPIKENFHLLTAGTALAANPGVLLSPEKVRRLLDVIKGTDDLVLFDSPPILAVSDNLILASMMDGVILVVRAGQTLRRDLVRAKEQLDRVGAPILGVVINQMSTREARRYYAPYTEYYAAAAPALPRSPLARARAWWGRRRNSNGRRRRR
jgi:succinoglycan biosynthesis transport protein ExoP